MSTPSASSGSQAAAASQSVLSVDLYCFALVLNLECYLCDVAMYVIISTICNNLNYTLSLTPLVAGMLSLVCKKIRVSD